MPKSSHRIFFRRTSLLLFVLLVFFNSALGASLREEVELEAVASFVNEVYFLYAQEDFPGVYRKMHPDIQDLLSEEEYTVFQKENFRQFDLRIGQVDVGKPLVVEESKMDRLVPETDTAVFLCVPVEYTMELKLAGIRQKRDISKDVFVYVDLEDEPQVYYLIWNPDKAID